MLKPLNYHERTSNIQEDNTELRAIFCKTDAIIPAVKIHSAAISTWRKMTWMKIAIIPRSHYEKTYKKMMVNQQFEKVKAIA